MSEVKSEKEKTIWDYLIEPPPLIRSNATTTPRHTCFGCGTWFYCSIVSNGRTCKCVKSKMISPPNEKGEKVITPLYFCDWICYNQFCDAKIKLKS